MNAEDCLAKSKILSDAAAREYFFELPVAAIPFNGDDGGDTFGELGANWLSYKDALTEPLSLPASRGLGGVTSNS